MDPSMPTTAGASGQPDRLDAVDQFKTMLAAERAKAARIQGELDWRNFALDCAPAHFMVIDVSAPRWSIIYVNRRIAKDHGYEPIELIGRTPGSLLPMDFNRDAFQRIEAAVSNSVTIRTELISRRKDGATFPVEFEMTAIRNPDGPVKHYLAVGTDISVRVEQARELQQLRDENAKLRSG
jgi:PAS domain S-box-containing protein